MTYYRFTNQDSPMSNWGHAMMAEDRDSVSHYGNREFAYSGENAVNIEDLKDVIISAWNVTIENGLEPIGYEDSDVEDIYNEFNPEDIVMSAGAWDDAELLNWFCDNIAIQNDIQAVLTTDGAIIFNELLLREVE